MISARGATTTQSIAERILPGKPASSISILVGGRGLRVYEKLTEKQIQDIGRAIANDFPAPKPALVLTFCIGGVLLGDFRTIPSPATTVLLIAVLIHPMEKAIDFIKCGKDEWAVLSAAATVIDNSVHYNIPLAAYNPAAPPPGAFIPDVIDRLSWLKRWGLSAPRLFMLPLPRRHIAPQWTPLPELVFPTNVFTGSKSSRVCTNPPEGDERLVMFDERVEKDVSSFEYLTAHALKMGMMLFGRAIGGKQPKKKRRAFKYFVAHVQGVTDVLMNPFAKHFSNFFDDKFEPLHLCLNEYLLNRPSKPFLDIEGEYEKNAEWKEKRDDLTLLAIDALLFHLKEYFPRLHLTYRDVLIVSNDTDKKFSRHAIVPRWMVASQFLFKHIMLQLYEKLCFCHDAPQACTAAMCKKQHMGAALFSHEENEKKKFIIDIAPSQTGMLRPAEAAKVPDEPFGALRILKVAALNTFPNVSDGASVFQASLIQYPYGGLYIEERILDLNVNIGDTLFGKPVAVDIFGHLLRAKKFKSGTKRARARTIQSSALADKIATCDWASMWSFHGQKPKVKSSGVYLVVTDEGEGCFCPFKNATHGGATVDICFRKQPNDLYKVVLSCYSCIANYTLVTDLGLEWAPLLGE